MDQIFQIFDKKDKLIAQGKGILPVALGQRFYMMGTVAKIHWSIENSTIIQYIVLE